MSLHGVEYELHTVHNLNKKHPDPESIPFLRIGNYARCDETGLSWFILSLKSFKNYISNIFNLQVNAVPWPAYNKLNYCYSTVGCPLNVKLV